MLTQIIISDAARYPGARNNLVPPVNKNYRVWSEN